MVKDPFATNTLFLIPSYSYVTKRIWKLQPLIYQRHVSFRTWATRFVYKRILLVDGKYDSMISTSFTFFMLNAFIMFPCSKIYGLWNAEEIFLNRNSFTLQFIILYACVALSCLALLAVLTQVAIPLETLFTVAMDEDLRMQSEKLASPQSTSVLHGVLKAKLAWNWQMKEVLNIVP